MNSRQLTNAFDTLTVQAKVNLTMLLIENRPEHIEVNKEFLTIFLNLSLKDKRAALERVKKLI